MVATKKKTTKVETDDVNDGGSSVKSNGSNGPKPAKPTKPAKAKVLYPEEFTEKRLKETGNEITPEWFKETLGLESEKEVEERVKSENPSASLDKYKFGDKFLFKDARGVKVRALRNSKNRPFDIATAEELAYVILDDLWEFNGETITVSNYGNVINGQHRGAGLYLANQILQIIREEGEAQRYGQRGVRWLKTWGDKNPYIESFVVYGIDEDPEVLRSIDNVRPRTTGDVLYSEGHFKDAKSSVQRQRLCKLSEAAVRMIWSRTGAGLGAFTPRRTHGLIVQFLEKHKKLEQCVKFIDAGYNKADERLDAAERRDVLSSRLAPGYAAALFYLMATSKSDGEAYRATKESAKPKLNYDQWDAAEEFWNLWCESDPKGELGHLFKQMALLDDGKLQGATVAEKVSTVVKAWNLFKDDKGITPSKLSLEYGPPPEGSTKQPLNDFPSVGGIDLGRPKKESKPKPSKPEETDEEPDEEEKARIEDQKYRERGEAGELPPDQQKVYDEIYGSDDDEGFSEPDDRDSDEDE